MLGPHRINMTSSWPSKSAMLGLKSRNYDLDLALSDCHAWSPHNRYDHESAFSDRPTWSHISHRITTLSKLSETAMPGPKMAND